MVYYFIGYAITCLLVLIMIIWHECKRGTRYDSAQLLLDAFLASCWPIVLSIVLFFKIVDALQDKRAKGKGDIQR